ncbi:hypothetical protein ACJMK2_034287 [Sinanodonta woodiana]|uniref:protein-tyrosine-phosphatase n=1 Tax=Sinanodonta woodiana TaxID=1069815 RepID=A0ABD3WUL4_SINWO
MLLIYLIIVYSAMIFDTVSSDCAPGSYFLHTQQLCSPCIPGTYKTSVGNTKCAECKPGTYSSSTGATSCTECEAGKYQPDWATSWCEVCEYGKTTNRNGSNSRSECVCAPGHYYYYGQCNPCARGTYKKYTGNTDCNDCHPGSYSSSAGAIACTECEDGTYQPNWRTSSCQACEGVKTTIGRGSNSYQQCVCPPGQYDIRGWLKCSPCQPGTYKPNAGDTSCFDCLPGTYSNSPGATSCTKCETGMYQPSTRQSSCHTCEIGKYQYLEGQTFCNACEDGTTTLGSGSTSSSQCVLACEPGKFHTDETDICLDCPTGTYQPGRGQSSCLSCKPGSFQNRTGQNDCVPCQAGSYSDNERATTCISCRSGTYQYSQKQSLCVPCPIGQYQPSEGQRSCYPCESGKTTIGVGSTSQNDCLTVCSAGEFRSNQSQACEKCSTGMYQPTPGQTFCLSCVAGTYQNQTGQISCMQCLPGSYQSSIGSEACIKCSAGFYQPDYGSYSQCLACPFGTYQDLGGAVSCIKCLAGTFQNQTGQMSCIPCPKGSYQSSEGTNKCIACPAGMYQNFVAQSQCLECPPGSYSSEPGSELCTQCDVGMYQNVSGQISCNACPNNTNTTGTGTKSLQGCYSTAIPTVSENTGITGAGSKEHSTNLFVIAGSAGAAISLMAVMAIVIFIVIRRHRLKETRSHETSGQDNVSPPQNESQLNGSIQQQVGEIAYTNLVHEEDSKENCKIVASDEHTSTNTYCNMEENPLLPRDAVMLSNLWDYVQEKILDGSKLSKEFEALPSGLLSSAQEALKPSNHQKNRYKGLYPYDSTRVRLFPLGEDKSDYINASFIDGYSRPKAYIASQGTTKFNINDFWRMAYQQDVEKIVMLTLLDEGDTMKCLQYWPQEGSHQQYGGIKVTLVHVDTFAEYDIRTLTMTVENTTKQVTQFHFTAWPDKGVPEAASSIVQFWHKVRNMQSHKQSPTLVHCSAGIGRTGTYIALDYLADQGKDKQYVQIFPCVAQLRRQRVNLVQTEAQYQFLHEALVEALMISGSAVTAETFPYVYKELLAIDRIRRKTGLLIEFEKLQNESNKSVYHSPGDYDTDDEEDDNEAEMEKITNNLQRTSRLEMNNQKNRYSNIIPADEYRPCLSFIEGRTDYINAVKLQSNRQKDGLIVTQMPMEDTVIDFWRLVYDFGVRTIVMLNVLPSNTDGIGVYWPDKGASTTEMVFNIENVDEKTDNPDYLWRTIRLTKDGEHPREIRQFQCNFWPGSKIVPKQMNAMLKLIDAVEQWQRQAEVKTVVIHCMDGAERSGLYCVLTTVLERLNIEKDVAIYQTVKKMKTRRQQIIPNFEQYKYCHDVVLEYLSNFGTYSNFT